MTTIEEALRDFLADSSAIVALVGNRIRTKRAEQKVVRPYIVIELGSSRDSYHAKGSTGKAMSFIDLRCVDVRYEDSRTLSELVKTYCGGFRGTWGDLAIASCIPGDVRIEEMFPLSGDEEGLETVVVPLTIWHAVEVPTN